MTGHRWTLHDVLCVACEDADDITCEACGRCQDCAAQPCERTRYVLTAEGAATVRRMMAEPEHLPATRRICTTCHGQRMTVGLHGPKVCDACNGDGVEVLA